MKLYFLKKDALDQLKGNIGSNINYYHEKSNNWIYEQFRGENPFGEFKIEVEEINLRTDFESASQMDLYNSKQLHSKLRFLSENQAADERFWAGLTHSTFFEFVQQRWGNENMHKANYIMSRYFYSGGQSRGIVRNTLSKLWWIGHFTYDSRRENPYELTEVLGNNDMATRVNDIFTSNFSRNPKLVHAFLGAVKEYEDNGIKIGGYTYRKAVQYMNAYGGITVVDYLEAEEMKKVIIKRIEKILKDPSNKDALAKQYAFNHSS